MKELIFHYIYIYIYEKSGVAAVEMGLLRSVCRVRRVDRTRNAYQNQ